MDWCCIIVCVFQAVLLALSSRTIVAIIVRMDAKYVHHIQFVNNVLKDLIW